MIYAFVAICLFGSALSRMLPAGTSCPNVETMKDFNITRYLGWWYQVESLFDSFPPDIKCVLTNHSLDDNGTIKIDEILIFGRNDRSAPPPQIARVPDPSEPAKFKIDFAQGRCSDCNSEYTYWILGTDYDSFAVVHYCSELKWITFEYALIFTRARNPSTNVIAKANEVITKRNITRNHFLENNHKECELSLLNDYPELT